MKKRYSLLVFILLALTALVNWWQSDNDGSRSVQQRKSHQYPDAFARQISVVSYDTQGLPRHRLLAPSMRHFEDDTAELQQPRFWQYEAGRPPWTVRSEKALLSEGEEKILLAGEVFIDREAAPGLPPYHITTRDLTLNTKTSYAETSQPVRVESGDEWITAIGMQGWLQAPVRIKLQQEVRAHYENL